MPAVNSIFAPVKKALRCEGAILHIDFEKKEFRVKQCKSRKARYVRLLPKSHTMMVENEKIYSCGQHVATRINPIERTIKSYDGRLKLLCQDCDSNYMDRYEIHVLDSSLQ